MHRFVTIARSFGLLAVLSVASAPLPGQGKRVTAQWSPVVADPAVKMDTITIHSGNDVITAYYAHPAKAGRYPAVIVLHANRITEPYIASTTEMLARAGFSAVALDLFHYLPGNETWESASRVRGDTVTAVMQREFREARMLRNIQSAVDYLHAQPSVATGGVGLLGFCGGGWNALITSAQLDGIGAVVAFYAPVALSDVQHRSPLALVSWMRAPIQYHVGTNDQWVPLASVDSFAQQLKAQHTPFERFTYEGAQHGFFAWNRVGPFSQPHAELAWKRLVPFLKANLGRPVKKMERAPAPPVGAITSGASYVLLHGLETSHHH